MDFKIKKKHNYKMDYVIMTPEFELDKRRGWIIYLAKN